MCPLPRMSVKPEMSIRVVLGREFLRRDDDVVAGDQAGLARHRQRRRRGRRDERRGVEAQVIHVVPAYGWTVPAGWACRSSKRYMLSMGVLVGLT